MAETPEPLKHDFDALLAAGDVVAALLVAPFGYSSAREGEGFHFAIESGPLKGREGRHGTLLGAVREAVGIAPPDSELPDMRGMIPEQLPTGGGWMLGEPRPATGAADTGNDAAGVLIEQAMPLSATEPFATNLPSDYPQARRLVSDIQIPTVAAPDSYPRPGAPREACGCECHEDATLDAAATAYREAREALEECERRSPPIGWENRSNGLEEAGANLILAALRSSPSAPLTNDEMWLRQQLWLRHGHRGIYGDDGEMQCGECHGLDFKRDDIAAIRRAMHDLDVTRMREAQLSSAPRETTDEDTKHYGGL